MKLYVRPDAGRLLIELSQLLTEAGIKSYLVGGFVRDLLLGRSTADIDIAVAADALEIASRVASSLSGKYIPLDEENRVGRVILFNNETMPTRGKWEIDISTLHSSIEQDLARRDFTIDAMAIELHNSAKFTPSSDMVIDPFNGQADLREGIVRAVSETAFEADAARLMRAVRLAAELNFCIDGGTKELIRRYSSLISKVAGERIREELLRILALPRAGQLMTDLEALGLLTSLIPELAPAKGVSQPKVHVWDVFDHSIQTVYTVEFILREGTLEYADREILSPVPWSTDLSEHFDQGISSGSTRRSLLKLAALLHDIAKPQTRTIDEDGRARFLGHPQDGANIAAGIMERLRFSNREIKLVELMVKYHLRPMQMSHEGLPTHRAIYRYFRDTGEAGISTLFLCLADHLATRGPHLEPAQWLEHSRMVEYVLTSYLEEENFPVPPKLIDGHDIIELFGLSPGPLVGKLLEELRETQAAGEVTNREQALRFVKNLINNRTLPYRSEQAQEER